MFLPRVPVLEFDQISAPHGEPNLEGRASQAAAFVGLFFFATDTREKKKKKKKKNTRRFPFMAAAHLSTPDFHK